MGGATMEPTSDHPDAERSPADAAGRLRQLHQEGRLEATEGSGVRPTRHRRVPGEEATVGVNDGEGSGRIEAGPTVGDADADATLDDDEKTDPATRFGFDGLGEVADTVELLFPHREKDRLGQWGPYEIQRELGRGGMGIVFQGFDFILRRTVALKVMNPALAASARSRARFVRESRAMAAISHPNIVTIHAVDEHRGIPYLVMEYVPGEALDERIQRLGSLPVAEVSRIGALIADGLQAAHDQGTIHRDIKPANVMLGADDRVKITDFGLALAVLENSELTPADHLLGTPSYAAPELIRGKAVDARADLYGLGCVLQTMATGRPPFTGKNIIDVARRACEEQPPRLDQINPTIPQALADLTLRLLEKEPENRIQTAAEVAAALRRLLAGRELEVSSPVPPAPLIGRWSAPKRPRHLRLWVVGTLLGVGAMVFSARGLWTWPFHDPSAQGLGHPPTSPGTVADPLALALPDPAAGPMRLVVSTTSPAHFRSLADAVAHATPGSTISLPAGEYLGPVRIAGARDLTIEGAEGAVLLAPADAITVLDVCDAPGLVVRGLTIRCSSAEQHGLRLGGDISGALVERVRVEQFADAPAAAIHAAPGARGSAESPARLRELDVDVTRLGIVLGSSRGSEPVSFIRVENSRIHGASGKSFLIVLETAVHDTVISGNILEGSDSGVSMALTDVSRPANLQIRNNTFFQCKSWVNLGYTEGEATGIDIIQNLVLDCDSVVTRTPDVAVVGPLWFRENVWRKSGPKVGLVARSVEAAPVLSIDPASPDYLRPADPASVTVKDESTGAAVFAGAVPPRVPPLSGEDKADSHL